MSYKSQVNHNIYIPGSSNGRTSSFGAIKHILYRAAGSSNGRTHGFGPWNLGSSPSPAAL
jgi:hypothetical protein